MATEDASVEVGQTCHLALDFIRWKEKRGGVKSQYAMQRMNEQGARNEDDEEVEEIEEAIAVCACMLPPYSSVDPAPPHPKHVELSTHEIGTILRDANAPLFERFRAMFSLRNRGGEDCVQELGKALGERVVSIMCRLLFVFDVYSSNRTYASFPCSLLGPIIPDGMMCVK